MKKHILVLALLFLICWLMLGCDVHADEPAAKTSRPNLWANACTSPSLFRAGNRCIEQPVGDKFADEVLPIIGQRCAACHGCADSPCQLKLTSYEGILRGASDYNLFKVITKNSFPSRITDHRFVKDDGTIDYTATEAAWRSRDRSHKFYSVTEVMPDSQQSLMSRLLEHAQAKKSDNSVQYRHDQFELWKNTLANRTFECFGDLEADDQASFVKDDSDAFLTPRAMPFGLPPIKQSEHATLINWLKNSAAPTAQAQLRLADSQSPQTIQDWEAFFNGEHAPANVTKAHKALFGRYLYEHMFFAHLAFPEAPGEFYELVRSHTQGGAIQEVITDHANDVVDGTFFYRLRKYISLPVRKSHITWELPATKRTAWNQLFFSTKWRTGADIDELANSDSPFEYFAAIPGNIRARWMLQNSYQIIDAMVRTDVCTGSGATYAIRDRFWVFFLKPDSDPTTMSNGRYRGMPKSSETMLQGVKNELISVVSNVVEEKIGIAVGKLVKTELDYRENIEKEFEKAKPDGLGINDIWTGGDIRNENAMLTVIRHGKSATVHRGAVNGYPKQGMWLLTYSNFEHLFYNLVVKFKVWGNTFHKLKTWHTMAFIRAEGESHFLSLLPGGRNNKDKNIRKKVYDLWAGSDWSLFESENKLWSENRKSAVKGIGTEAPVRDLTLQLLKHLGPEITGLTAAELARGPTNAINTSPENGKKTVLPKSITNKLQWEAALSLLTQRKTSKAQLVPNATVIRVQQGTTLADDNSNLVGVYTLIANRGYKKGHKLVSQQNPSRLPENDTISIVRGVASDYPELFIVVPLAGAADFLGRIINIKDTKDFQQLLGHLSAAPTANRAQIIDRTSEQFWPFFDWLHDWSVKQDPVGAGIFDISNYIFRQADRTD